MSRVKKYFIFLPLVLIFGCSEETITPNVTVAIQGVVFDQQTEALLPDARVTVINTFDVLETDSVGRFRFDSLNFRETFTIRVEKTGYRDQTATLNFLQDGNPEREVEIPMDIDLDLNKAPEAPVLRNPTNRENGVSINPTLRWTGATADEGDSISYLLELYSERDPDPLVFETTDTVFTLTGLNYATRYFWQVSARDGVNSPSRSVLSSFTTEAFPDYRVHFVRRDSLTGNLVVFAGETPILDNTNQVDSLGVIPISDPERSCWRPHLNLPANRVAYLSFVGAEAHIFTMGRDGSNVQQVTSTRAVNTLNLLEANYAWSPNGGQFIYPHKDKLMVINENGTGLREFATADLGYFFTEVDWANQGVIAARMQRANRYQSKIVLYREDGTLIDTLLNGSNRGRWMGGPALSEGGDFAVFTEDQNANQFPDEQPRSSRIFRVSDTGEASTVGNQVIPDNSNDLYPMVPPGGDVIIFVNRPSDNARVGDVTIMRVNANAEDSRQIVYPNATMPDWR